ncbi:polysaccharide pyruvyl transferase family protein [Zhihengliuella sp.]|uniref:polysaccharide pyruvyl transferase family protein n=1 Tax=Zhihengliuella sp. TaxID=1954483 RepID=UPI0028125FCB|nr:polysaccharide pyruvyl transferase family protein [Zhihengliuella sp.]
MSVKLYWWRSRNGGHNLGDELTPILLKELFEIDAELSPMASADIVGAGSVLGWAWSLPGAADNTMVREIHVVGSGLMKPEPPNVHLDGLKLHSVRGYLSKALLPESMTEQTTVGDPGLLVSRVVHEQRGVRHRLGVIPHVGWIGRSRFAELTAGLPEHTVIDFRTDNLQEILSQMSQCEVILSQSLHGLILSDALRIPNAWLDLGSLHPGGSFKFYDYFSSVGRPFEDALTVDDSMTWRSIDDAVFQISGARLRARQHEILQAFRSAIDASGAA